MLLTPSPLSQTVTPSRTPSPLERDVLHGRPRRQSLARVENCTYSVMQLRVIRPRRSYRFMLRKYWGRDQNDQCYTRTFAAGNVGKPHAGKTRLGVGPRGLGTQELSVDVLYALYGQPYAVLYFNTT